MRVIVTINLIMLDQTAFFVIYIVVTSELVRDKRYIPHFDIASLIQYILIQHISILVTAFPRNPL